MEDVKSILVASERLFGCGSDPAEMMQQTRVVAEVSSFSFIALSMNEYARNMGKHIGSKLQPLL